MKNLYKIQDELYVVSNNEDVSENCWIITSGKLVQVSCLLSDEVAKGFKVILTTNKLLIKDGVQAIPDEFLEWFVKNPSCERVEIEKGYRGYNLVNYKIFIPKEEPKEKEMFLMNANETVDTRSIVEKMKPLQEQWQKDMEESLNTKQKSILKCELCERYPRLEGTNKCESCYSVIRHFLEQDPELKSKLLPDLRKEQETSSVGAENQIFKIVLDEKCRPNKVSIIEADNNSVLKKQETLEKITEQIQNECHIFVESVTNVTYQDATNTFLFMKLAELTLKLKKYE